MSRLKMVHISGFKSLKDTCLELGDVNVLIGANGVGKSNFTNFFHMLTHMMSGALEQFIGISGGANDQLYLGAKTTPVLTARLELESENGTNSYAFILGHASPDCFIFLSEAYSYSRFDLDPSSAPSTDLGSGHVECRLRQADNSTGKFICSALKKLRFYQFHDTSRTALMKQTRYLDDHRFLRSDAGNLAAFLFMLQQRYPVAYKRIRRTLQRVLPFFEDFQLAPSMLNNRNIQLEWHEKGAYDTFGPHQLSDGSLRMMALTTLLLQPKELLPSLMIIDEPELGLHPSAIKLLAAMVRSASANTQIILATQSKRLVDEFELEQLVVLDRSTQNGHAFSTLKRLAREELAVWMEQYSLGDMWEKNLIGGRQT